MTRIMTTTGRVGIVCAVIAALFTLQGCRRAVSVSPSVPSEKQVATEKAVAPKTPVKEPVADSKSADTAKSPGKPTAVKPAKPKPAQQAAVQPQEPRLPSADLDAHDAKYVDGPPPKIEANGKPVTLLYFPPHMFMINLTQGGQQKANLTLGTVTSAGAGGNALEVHVLVRPDKPSDSKFERVALIYSDKTRKGQSWKASAAGMDFKVEVLDYGEWPDSPFPGTGMGWMKLKITVK